MEVSSGNNFARAFPVKEKVAVAEWFDMSAGSLQRMPGKLSVIPAKAGIS
jgi:hypothetical protein